MIDIFMIIFGATILTDFVIRRGVDLYLHMKDKLDEHIKH